MAAEMVWLEDREEGSPLHHGRHRRRRGRAGILSGARRGGRGARRGADPEASQEVFRLAGRLAVPTVLIDERVFLGFSAHREEIETLMRE